MKTVLERETAENYFDGNLSVLKFSEKDE